MKGSGVQLSPDRAHPSKGDDKKYSEKDVCKDRSSLMVVNESRNETNQKSDGTDSRLSWNQEALLDKAAFYLILQNFHIFR